MPVQRVLARRRDRGSPSRARAAPASRTRPRESAVVVPLALDLGLASRPEVEDRALAGEPVGVLLAAPGERLLEQREHALARRPGRVERAALDEALERALVHDLRVDALAEVPERREGAAFLAGRDDRADGRLADVLHGVQAEADLALDDREVERRDVHVGRQHLDPHLVAGGDVERHLVLRVHDRGDQGGHVLGRVVRLQVGGAVGDQRVAGGVRLVEGVVLRLLHVLPELLGDLRLDCVRLAPFDELVLERRHQRVDLLADRLAEIVGLGRREAGEVLRDLHVLLLVDADAVRVRQ